MERKMFARFDIFVGVGVVRCIAQLYLSAFRVYSENNPHRIQIQVRPDASKCISNSVSIERHSIRFFYCSNIENGMIRIHTIRNIFVIMLTGY